eukprot:TRINITY_DN9370_c0_g1_i1.p1 TRINITY_DN9370_c0_g1~~TRINITY_DN9370_c0_g1_i1.p1  ORF type:complete len:305 (+),score=42.80 TRINITY_DN9370_c0_g1_i1:85-999(+)
MMRAVRGGSVCLCVLALLHLFVEPTSARRYLHSIASAHGLLRSVEPQRRIPWSVDGAFLCMLKWRRATRRFTTTGCLVDLDAAVRFERAMISGKDFCVAKSKPYRMKVCQVKGNKVELRIKYKSRAVVPKACFRTSKVELGSSSVDVLQAATTSKNCRQLYDMAPQRQNLFRMDERRPLSEPETTKLENDPSSAVSRSSSPETSKSSNRSTNMDGENSDRDDESVGYLESEADEDEDDHPSGADDDVDEHLPEDSGRSSALDKQSPAKWSPRSSGREISSNEIARIRQIWREREQRLLEARRGT